MLLDLGRRCQCQLAFAEEYGAKRAALNFRRKINLAAFQSEGSRIALQDQIVNRRKWSAKFSGGFRLLP